MSWLSRNHERELVSSSPQRRPRISFYLLIILRDSHKMSSVASSSAAVNEYFEEADSQFAFECSLRIKASYYGPDETFGTVSTKSIALASPVQKNFIFPPFPQLNSTDTRSDRGAENNMIVDSNDVKGLEMTAVDEEEPLYQDDEFQYNTGEIKEKHTASVSAQHTETPGPTKCLMLIATHQPWTTSSCWTSSRMMETRC